MDKNVLLISTAMMFYLCSSQTLSNIQETLTEDIKAEYSSFNVDGYYNQAVGFVSYALFNCITPSVIATLGLKCSMCIGSLINIFFVLQFFIPNTWAMYLLSILSGFGASLLWTALGSYITLSSTEKTITRNIGISSTVGNSSLIIGNVFVTFVFNGKEKIDKTSRMYIIIILAIFGLAAFIVYLLLPKINEQIYQKSAEVQQEGPIQALVESIKLFFTTKMLLLNVSFLFIGLEMGLYGSVYSTCLGFTEKFNDRKRLVGISGIFVGIGDVLGSILFIIIGHTIDKWGRNKVLALTCLVYCLNFILMFLNLSNDSTFSDTNANTIIYSNAYLGLFCSFLLGVGDAIFYNVVSAYVSIIYAENSAPAFAIMQLLMAIGLTITVVSGQLLGLYYQLAVLLFVAILSVVLFRKVEYLYTTNLNTALSITTKPENS